MAHANIDETCTDDPLIKAVDDLKEWMQDNDAAAIVSNLRPGAPADEISEVEARIGYPFPASLRKLYELHDGQEDREANAFFEGEQVFADLDYGLGLMSGMLLAYFGAQTHGPGGREWGPGMPPPPIDRKRVRCDERSGLRDEEYSAMWWPMAADTSGAFIAVNLRTGRVFFAEKDFPPLKLVADDVVQFVTSFANDVWNDAFEVVDDIRDVADWEPKPRRIIRRK